MSEIVKNELDAIKEFAEATEKRGSTLTLNELNYISDKQLHKKDGGGGGATVLTATVSGSTATFPCMAAELFAYMQSGAVVVKFISSNPEDPSEYADFIYLIHSAQHYSDDSYDFTSNGFEINCATGSDIPSFPVA